MKVIKLVLDKFHRREIRKLLELPENERLGEVVTLQTKRAAHPTKVILKIIKGKLTEIPILTKEKHLYCKYGKKDYEKIKLINKETFNRLEKLKIALKP